METVALPYSPDQTISPYKQIRKTPKRNNIRTTTVPRPENFSPANLVMNLQGGVFLRSPSLSRSFSNAQPQPPLLPLPINNKPCSPNRGLSCPSTNRKSNRNRDQDLTLKKPKSSSGSPPPKKQNSRSVPTECLVITSTERLGPEPSDLPEEIMRVMKPSVASENDNNKKKNEDEKFSGSVFYLSPPPSSLPLPKFSLRPKLSCNAEAEGIDAGATDNLRRLLRLQ
ncbi:uncharacterized protein LOC122059237 [Macadamia integrifolia]|uniref:uncharacterized protein LOC122059237 n=1 Tax=Macadamia integrifolia TaxID=60698 RepID=UPI001C52CB64|nr:uncharacterized protein LOC122059237 [Macadamia integrifolia]